MGTIQNKYNLMKSKLDEGLKILSEASEYDTDKLGMALIKIHGAMEDFVRIEVARKAPHLGDTVQDAKLTNWKSLLDYGKTYLGFTERDCQTITEANFQRQTVAHGGNYDRTLGELQRYAKFVQGWCSRGQVSASEAWDKEPIARPQQADKPTYRPAYEPPPSIREGSPVYKPSRGLPWYRSTFFLFFAFFLLPPVWGLLMLTGRQTGCFVRLIAFTMLSIQVLFFVFVMYPNLSSYVDLIQNFFRPLDIPSASPQVTHGAPTPTLVIVPPGSFVTEAPTNTNTACVIIWAEHPADDLGGKNRSMVWVEFVKGPLKGSGLTRDQFYDLVVEKNPHLAKDGYEFKKGKKYVLPRCQ